LFYSFQLYTDYNWHNVHDATQHAQYQLGGCVFNHLPQRQRLILVGEEKLNPF
jgi:hypothetical protein